MKPWVSSNPVGARPDRASAAAAAAAMRCSSSAMPAVEEGELCEESVAEKPAEHLSRTCPHEPKGAPERHGGRAARDEARRVGLFDRTEAAAGLPAAICRGGLNGNLDLNACQPHSCPRRVDDDALLDLGLVNGLLPNGGWLLFWAS